MLIVVRLRASEGGQKAHDEKVVRMERGEHNPSKVEVNVHMIANRRCDWRRIERAVAKMIVHRPRMDDRFPLNSSLVLAPGR